MLYRVQLTLKSGEGQVYYALANDDSELYEPLEDLLRGRPEIEEIGLKPQEESPWEQIKFFKRSHLVMASETRYPDYLFSPEGLCYRRNEGSKTYQSEDGESFSQVLWSSPGLRPADFPALLTFAPLQDGFYVLQAFDPCDYAGDYWQSFREDPRFVFPTLEQAIEIACAYTDEDTVYRLLQVKQSGKNWPVLEVIGLASDGEVFLTQAR